MTKKDTYVQYGAFAMYGTLLTQMQLWVFFTCLYCGILCAICHTFFGIGNLLKHFITHFATVCTFETVSTLYTWNSRFVLNGFLCTGSVLFSSISAPESHVFPVGYIILHVPEHPPPPPTSSLCQTHWFLIRATLSHYHQQGEKGSGGKRRWFPPSSYIQTIRTRTNHGGNINRLSYKLCKITYEGFN